MPSLPSSRNSIPMSPSPDAWAAILSASLAALNRLTGSSEHDFLQIGSRLQEIHQRSLALSETAQRLVDAASGDRIQTLMERLHRILQEMKAYLEQTQESNLKSCTTLNTVKTLLQQIIQPLAGFKRMSKNLYILEVSIKIESTYSGEMEGEFLNLAQDIKKLSGQIKEKVTTVQDHRQRLSAVIAKNIADIHAAKSNQDTQIRSVMSDTAASLSGLQSVNERFFRLGEKIATLSEESSNSISDIVQSMQIHDMYRQQVEHVIAALEEVPFPTGETKIESPAGTNPGYQELISKAGDICEIQEAQLQCASAEFHLAVSSIVTNLRDISSRQKRMRQDILSQTEAGNASGTSFVDDVSEEMSSIADLLGSCADTNNELAELTKVVTSTVEEITLFVADIEDIGHEIIQIALNSRIKAAYTDKNGAALSALSEEIGQLSHHAVQSADKITATLVDVHSATKVLAAEASSNEETLGTRLSGMKEELSITLRFLEEMRSELLALLPQIHTQVESLTGEIEELAGGIDVHERAKTLAAEVVQNFQRISRESRALYPASAAFKEDLRLLAQRYTMESERRIHENIAGKHGMSIATPQAPISETSQDTDADTEFGDNVDLF